MHHDLGLQRDDKLQCIHLTEYSPIQNTHHVLVNIYTEYVNLLYMNPIHQKENTFFPIKDCFFLKHHGLGLFHLHICCSHAKARSFGTFGALGHASRQAQQGPAWRRKSWLVKPTPGFILIVGETLNKAKH